ncbi:MAG: helix-turn-helix domain-containing protein [Candidatus Daviesbacteria bacterium]|nr:helix-turn-helix domain-containing protein [Candidatus Daviesbacteria bacterium]
MTAKKDKELGLYSLKEACELLKVHPQTLRQWDKKGLLKAVRIGLRQDRRYRKEDILKLVHK